MTRFLPTVGVVLCLAFGSLAARNEIQSRTVFVSALDKLGAPVPDLTSAELVVKENGKVLPAINVAPARQPVRLALVVHNRVQGNPEFREGLTAFVDAMQGRGE